MLLIPYKEAEEEEYRPLDKGLAQRWNSQNSEQSDIFSHL